MKTIILGMIVLVLVIGVQAVSAESEYNLGYKLGLSDAKTKAHPSIMGPPDLKATKNEIDKHPHAFYQGWIDGFCSITHMVFGSEEFTFDCSTDTSQAKSYFIAHPGFWTSNSSYIPQGYTQYHVYQGYTQYHVYLYGTWPSSTNEATKIVNEHLNVCVDFSTDQKPYLCHRVSPSQIPPANDSVIDAGIFVVPRSFNASEARACVSISYHNMYDCGRNGPEDLFTHHLFFGSMDDLIYEDAITIHACADIFHFKEGTPKYNECLDEAS